MSVMKWSSAMSSSMPESSVTVLTLLKQAGSRDPLLLLPVLSENVNVKSKLRFNKENALPSVALFLSSFEFSMMMFGECVIITMMGILLFSLYFDRGSSSFRSFPAKISLYKFSRPNLSSILEIRSSTRSSFSFTVKLKLLLSRVLKLSFIAFIVCVFLSGGEILPAFSFLACFDTEPQC